MRPPLLPSFALVVAMTTACERPSETGQSPLPLGLPYAWGEAYSVVQGNDGIDTHQGLERYAWDFAMPEGTPVLAAASGRVVTVVDAFAEHGRASSFANRANVVVIDIGDGLFAVYQHLAPRSAVVREGERVYRGQMLARSGNTGMTEHPHLHFAVVDHKNQSVPFDFAEAPRRSLTSGARPLSRNGQPPPSLLPLDAFAANGIELTGEVPPLPWKRAALALSGRARGDAVVAFLLDRATHQVLRQNSVSANADGSFSVTLELGGLDGLYDFAMAVPSAAGAFSSDFSVPVVVRPDVAPSFGVVP